MLRMSDLNKGERGVVTGFAIERGQGVAFIAEDELERRLLEMGFVEGARFQILHEGLIGRDPIAVKLDDMRIGLRRREANMIIVEM
ncbi:MAG TPA: FeoA family protein [Rhizomicrobium sp.]|nr:FeoA family protein [Rhizomicrobium sp.]